MQGQRTGDSVHVPKSIRSVFPTIGTAMSSLSPPPFTSPLPFAPGTFYPSELAVIDADGNWYSIESGQETISEAGVL